MLIGIIGIFFLFILFLYAYVYFNKKAILRNANEKISTAINGKVTIGDVSLAFFTNFPNIAVELRDVSITDSMFVQHHHELLSARKILIALNTFKLFSKKVDLKNVVIKNATIYLYTDSLGYSNKYLLKPKNKDTSVAKSRLSKPEDVLNKLELDSVSVIIDDHNKNKLYSFLANNLIAKSIHSDSSLHFKINHDVILQSFSLNVAKGSFAKNQLFRGTIDLHYNTKQKELKFETDSRFTDQAIQLIGDFKLDTLQSFSLKIISQKIQYSFAQTLLTEHIAKAMSIVSITKPLNVIANISGSLAGGEPLINVSCASTKDNIIKTNFNEFKNCTFSATFTNQFIKDSLPGDPNSIIELQNFTGNWEEVPLKSEKIRISNLKEPYLECTLISDFDLSTLNSILSSDALHLEAGKGKLNLDYKGPLGKKSDVVPQMNGTVNITDGIILYGPRNVQMTGVTCLLFFENSDLTVKELSCSVGDSKIQMSGKADNLVSLLYYAPDKIKLHWNIYCPTLNLESFTALLAPKQKTINVPKKKSFSKLGKLAANIDALLDNGDVYATLKADKLRYQNFTAQNLNANLSLIQNNWQLQNVTLNHAGGLMNLTGSATQVNSTQHLAKIKLNFEKMDAKKVFYAFNNFGQSNIESKNISGNLTAKANISMLLNNKGAIHPGSVKGNVYFSLKNGGLVNYEPLKKIQSFIFKKRDFNNITFAELKDSLIIADNTINIRRMEIQSSVMSLFVEGAFGITDNKNTNISIQIPLSNFKKRDSTYIPKNIGTDAETGLSIFLRAKQGEDGSVKLSYDKLKRFKKKKK